MIDHALEVWLYAPLRLVLYESRDGNTFVAYNRFASLLAQYRHPEVARITHVVEDSRAFRIQDANTIPSSKAVFGRSANKPGVLDNNSRSTIASLVYMLVGTHRVRQVLM